VCFLSCAVPLPVWLPRPFPFPFFFEGAVVFCSGAASRRHRGKKKEGREEGRRSQQEEGRDGATHGHNTACLWRRLAGTPWAQSDEAGPLVHRLLFCFFSSFWRCLGVATTVIATNRMHRDSRNGDPPSSLRCLSLNAHARAIQRFADGCHCAPRERPPLDRHTASGGRERNQHEGKD
jgi:hypothetical protein